MATIDTNMSLVMIDPSEPLELYDGTIIKGRLEWFLYALCCLDYGNLPTPLSRIEEWANALITNELPNMEPQSRAEEFFKAILTGDTSNLPTPQSRSEVLLDKLARGENDFTNVEKIQSRYEFLLAYLIKNGGGIGNIDYVLYKFQKEDETLYNTKERPVKSAILKGQTLVNLMTNCRDEYVVRYNDINNPNNNVANISMMKPNTEYTLFYKAKYRTQGDGAGTNGSLKIATSIEQGFIITAQSLTTEYKQYVYRFTTSSVVDCFVFSSTDKYFAIKECVLLEGDYTNVDIPFFEGMQSVKMPVLKTTGKNLFDIEENTHVLAKLENGNYKSIPHKNFNLPKFKEKTSYTLSFSVSKFYDGTYQFPQILYTDGTKLVSYRANQTFNGNPAYILTSDPNKTISHIEFSYGSNDITLEFVHFQIEEGSVATSYEPFKSNILSCNEEVELRGIGDVQDELNVATGELTQRIGEIVLDGSENWMLRSSTYDNVVLFYNGFNICPNGVPISEVKSDRLISRANFQWITQNEGIYPSVSNEGFFLSLSKARNIDTTDKLKRWLSQNEVTVQYRYSSESIKTVDLTITDQGGATIPKLNTFDKITHVNVSATDVLPGVEMEVATTIGEDLSGTLYSTMEDIETKQEALKEPNNAQTESVNSTMMATTEIYESLL